ncbi:solute carrier family 52, riboflavin transporter, member 3-B-like [Haliotis asinina]|uniref:solute carrier family 52, riboflavin transporter, member 3-B-like n=1 Tax=Haliotis asinina TaxID=109174 RepID=UPI0035323313
MACTKDVNILIYIFIILFGVSSWVDINGMWVELPIMVQKLPEGWNLPSFMVVLTQLANIGPLLYAVVAHRVPEKVVIYIIIAIGALACLLLVFLWEATTVVAGHPHSTAMMSLYFILSLVDCASNVVLFPFMAIFRPVYLTAYFIGEGFSGLFPGLIGLAQGAGRIICRNTTTFNATVNGSVSSITPDFMDENFSFEVFMSIISGIIVISGISFTFLIFHPVSKREYVRKQESGEKLSPIKTTENPEDESVNEELAVDESALPLTTQEKLQATEPDQETGVRRFGRNLYLLVLVCWVNCLRNSALLAVQSFSCLPYGVTQYHLAVTLANLANPLACFFDLFVHVTSVPALSSLTLLGSLFGAYIMAAAVMSPVPVLVGTLAGSILIVSAWVVCIFILTYVKVSLASLFRVEGKKGLLHCGVATQVGSAIGGVLMFVLVNVLNLFKSVDPCS